MRYPEHAGSLGSGLLASTVAKLRCFLNICALSIISGKVRL